MDDPASIPEGRLLKVYPKEGADDETSVDIIAIHGLGTTNPHTWEYKTNTRPVNWLTDSNMLPAVVPSARVYTFSWNARYYEDASVARIENVAEVLLSNLQSQRDKQDTHLRPLIFIASCFGGLIITKALEIANIYNSQYRKLIVANSGIIFLASPLQGTKAAKAAQWQAMLGGILNKESSRTLLQDLDGSTRALRETSKKFVAMVTNPPMKTLTMCFWESQRSKVLKAVLPAGFTTLSRSVKMMIVEEDSACLFGRPKRMLDAPHSMMNKFFGPSDANFILVSDTVKEMVKEARNIVVSQGEAFHLYNEHFLVMRRPNPLFTGREDELERLKQALCPSESRSEETSRPKIHVIQGMGGAGKSEVAVKFAHDNRPKFWGIFWIDARSESSITNGFAHIARRCGQHDDSLGGAISWLQNTRHSWLLILDNANNADQDLDQFLPAGRKGSILITTRLAECAKYHTAGHPDCYEKLSRETATTLLLKACELDLSLRSAHEENAHGVVDLLGCHALAVIQAGAAISQGLCNLREYREMFLTQRRTLFDCFPKQARSEYGGVYATFEVSARHLASLDDPTGEDALELLSFYSSMHYTDFPEAAFEEVWINSRDETLVSSALNADGEEDIAMLSPWHISNLPTFMRNDLDDLNLHKMRIREARSLLVSLSLVAFDSVRGTTHMHPVSHSWSRDRLKKQEKWNAGMNGLCVLSLSMRDPFTLDFDHLRSQLQPHIESITFSMKEWGPQNPNFHFQQSIYRLGFAMYRLQCGLALSVLLETIPVLADDSWIKTANGQRIQTLHAEYIGKFGDASTLLVAGERETDSSETASIASAWSEFSESSASSYASAGDISVAALDGVIAVFMSDEKLRCLFAEAFTKQHQDRVSRKGARLLRWLGRRLVMAANTPAEKEAAKFFSSRRRDQAMIDKIAQGITTLSSGKERHEQTEEEVRQQEATKQERLELYLQQQMGKPPINLESEETPALATETIENGGSDASSDSDDEDKDKQQTVQLNIDAVKLFLKSSDAFARFKEEFEDLINPFRNEAMWTKTLWNSGERVRFEHSSNVPRLTNIDKLKIAAEEKLGMPLLWWPLKQPRKHLSSSKIRIIWICECGNETYVDVSCAKARRYRQMCDTSPGKVTASQPSILPTNNEPVADSSDSGGFKAWTSALMGKFTRLQQIRIREKRTSPTSQGSEQNATIVSNATPTSKYVHWCVDTAPRRTFLHHICIEQKKGKDFIDELCISYKKLRGWRWYLSMTTCTEIKLVKLSRVYNEEEAVICTYKGDVLPNLNDQNEYTYNIDPPDLEKEIHILRAERALIDYYHGHKNCHVTDHINQLVNGIPHRVTGTKLGLKGYGIWARQGWTLSRLATFALITQGWTLVFVAVWLWYHPGDLQNAFSPGYYSLGIVTVFVAIPDVFLT